MTMHLRYKSKEKEVYVDDQTRIEKTIYIKDPQHLEAIKHRDTIQPIGKDKREFFDRYKHLKEESGGKIINKNEERKRKEEKAQEIEEYERKEFARKRKENAGYKMFH